MLEMFFIRYISIWPNFILIDSEEISIGVTLLCSNAYDDVTDFEICGFQKTQKSIYLENKTLFFLQIKKKSLITHHGLLYGKK